MRETTDAYQAMLANEAKLDEKVDAFVRSTCKKEGIRLQRISRCGNWYLEEIGQKLLQCCVVRLYHLGKTGAKRTILREYAIACGDSKTAVFELLA